MIIAETGPRRRAASLTTAGFPTTFREVRRIRDAIEDFGEMLFFGLDTLRWAFRRPFRPELILVQMAAIGVGSVFIVSTTAFFTGVVLALQANYAMRQLGAEGYVGGSVAISLARELAPVLTALFVIGRSGSAISTEIGTMRVTEQIDALKTLSTDPFKYLVAPRLIAGIVTLPMLVLVADIIGVPVDRPTVTETTALGAVYLAGFLAGAATAEASNAGTADSAGLRRSLDSLSRAGFRFPYSPSVYGARVDDFYWYENQRVLPLWYTLWEVNNRLRDPAIGRQ